MDNKVKLPFYAKTSIILAGLLIAFTMLYLAQEIIIPLVFATIISIVLRPIVQFLVRRGINRVLSIILTLFLTFVAIVAVGTLLVTQMSNFSESWPTLVDRLTTMLNESITWVSGYFDINQYKILQWITKTKGELLNIDNTIIGHTLVSVGSGIMVLLLVPVYTFIILYYERLLIEFIHRLFSESVQPQVSETLTQTKTVIQRYLIGLIIEAVLVAALNITVLLALGIDYAILLGVIGALLNVIPYIGGIVGVALPMMVALATKSTGWYAIYVLVLYYIIQLIDNNYIVPIIEATKVKINALFSIIVVIAGNALWGISGMFLSLPLLAIVKLICDHIEPLKPWGFLLGDTMPPLLKMKSMRLLRSKKRSTH